MRIQASLETLTFLMKLILTDQMWKQMLGTLKQLQAEQKKRQMPHHLPSLVQILATMPPCRHVIAQGIDMHIMALSTSTQGGYYVR